MTKTATTGEHTASASESAETETPQRQYEGSMQNTLLPAMAKIDPFVRFLTKATGKTSIPLKLLQQVLPKASAADANDSSNADRGAKNNDGEKADDNNHLDEILIELTHRGVLKYEPSKKTVGFPLPPSPSNTSDSTTATQSATPSAAGSTLLRKPPSKLTGKGLHGSSEPAAKRRMKVLKWSLELVPSWICRKDSGTEALSVALNAKKSNASKPRAKRSPRKRGFKSTIESESTECTTTERRKRTRGDKGGYHSVEQKTAQVCSKSKSNSADEEGEQQPIQDEIIESDERLDKCIERRDAYQALDALLRGLGSSLIEKESVTANNTEDSGDKQNIKQWLPCQAAYAGSQPGREVRYGTLSKKTMAKIPAEILQLFDLDLDSSSIISATGDTMGRQKRRLFLHQTRAIDSAMDGVHTVVQTATGSGKSFCFLLPVLAKAMLSLQQQYSNQGGPPSAALLLFPTKALAQDQFSKIDALLQSLSSLTSEPAITLRAGVIDGDTPHSQRDEIASTCQIILTNPDTLHASMIPNWKKRAAYQKLLARVSTVVVDEAHVYEGAFGAHVAMVLARLKRVCRVASSPSNSTDNSASPTRSISFIACSATMLHPEQHFRLLCPVGKEENVCVLTPDDDGSPCAAKHFFVWNPPILDVNGNSTQRVFLAATLGRDEGDPISSKEMSSSVNNDDKQVVDVSTSSRGRRRKKTFNVESTAQQAASHHHSNLFTRRRHAADETAFLLAKAISVGIRTIAFCKTRSLVEWVYERTLSILQSDPKTIALTSKVESYRGGYTAEARRSIEERLFHKKLWGVVGTCALELGVDVGGVDLTLHTGYPGSISSLLQQSGRAGRGKFGPNVPSCAIMVCFSSPPEQHIWKNPNSLMSRGVHAPPTLPINATVMQGHLLCAGEEFPLVGNRPVSCLLNEASPGKSFSNDCDLIGTEDVYQDNIKFLVKKGLLSVKQVKVVSGRWEISKSGRVDTIVVHSTHPVVKNPWKRVSLRSIEPLSYSIVDLSHNLQGGKTDKIHNQAAVMDTIPYSRVFYHAFPGSIIMHRGRKYKIESMESPPPFVGGASFGPCGCSNLIAFAKPTSLSYSTQALSTNQITVVKQMKHAELKEECEGDSSGKPPGDGEQKQKEAENVQRSNKKSMREFSVLCQPVDNGKQKEEDETKGRHSGISTNAVAGYGVVTVKRTVHGYKKLSHVNRKELSRTAISMPPMEFDTYALWIDADAAYLRDVVFNFDSGVHALSHAMVAVAPLFVACTSSDIDCDHSRYDCTRILLYDQRAGGSGIVGQLYTSIVDTLKTAVDLLEECTSCYSTKSYDGGCPACLQSVPCDNFNQDLSRSAGISVGKHLIRRLENSNLNSRKKWAGSGEMQTEEIVPAKGNAVRTKLGADNMQMQSSIKPKNIVIGRASWMENGKNRSRWAEVDD